MLKNSEFQMRIERAALLLADFERALDRLNIALSQPENEFVRDSAIQRFEFSFELAWKSIQLLARLEGMDCATPRAAFSLAWQAHWLEDEDLWLDMLSERNKTTHTYREAIAKEVYSPLPKFLPAFRALLRALHSRIQALRA
jgi:nucleotidyltransferase substrate binding protein (TIGR01987 family)